MVRHPGVGVVRVRVVNAGADGLLVEWRSSAPAKGAVVALAETRPGRLQEERFRLRALVVHSRNERVGLMFVGERGQRGMAEALLRSLEAGVPAPTAAGGAEWIARVASAGY